MVISVAEWCIGFGETIILSSKVFVSNAWQFIISIGLLKIMTGHKLFLQSASKHMSLPTPSLWLNKTDLKYFFKQDVAV